MHSETCATNPSDTYSEYPDNLFNFDEVAEVYEGDNVMNMDILEAILLADPPTGLGDQPSWIDPLTVPNPTTGSGSNLDWAWEMTAMDYNITADQYLADHYTGSADQMILADTTEGSMEWNDGEWKDTAEYWKRLLEDDANILADPGESAAA